jgi:hypothetical protein
MTETYFHRLNLPATPVKNAHLIDNYEWTDNGYHIWTRPSYHLSDELLDIFNRTDLIPGYLVFFCEKYSKTVGQRMVHTDLVTEEDPRLVTQIDRTTRWRKSSFGINFELYGGLNEFHWYSTPSTTKEVWPSSDVMPLWYSRLQGIHYGSRKQLGIPPDCQEQACTVIDSRPTLVRTDVPHSTGFEIPSNSNIRLGVSIRFYEPWTWEEAKERFSSLFA